MDKYLQYVVASVHLYGAVTKETVISLYEYLNGECLFFPDFPEEMLREYGITCKNSLYYENHKTNAGLSYELQLKMQYDLYIPNENELLRYVDPLYYEKGNGYRLLMKRLKEVYSGDVYALIDQLYLKLRGDMESIASSIDLLTEVGIDLDNTPTSPEIMYAVIRFMSEVRLPAYHGNRRIDIEQALDIHRHEDKELHAKKQKVGRNDPCPCGSGKKYKKCCLNE